MRTSPLPRILLLGLLAIAAPLATAADPPVLGARPSDDPEADRAQYLDAERARADARSNPDYGRYDRADRNRARDAAHERMDARFGHRWAVGGYVHAGNDGLQVVGDYRDHGLRRPPRGSRWMRDGHGDLLLVVVSSGLISDVVPYGD